MAKVWFWALSGGRLGAPENAACGRRGRRRWALLALLAGGRLLAPSPLLAQAQPAGADDAVALVEVMSLPAKVGDGHLRLRSKLADVLAPKGWTLMTPTPLEDCESSAACAAQARQARVRYLLRMSGAPNQDDGYDFVLELFAADAAVARRTAAYCNYCDIDRMGEVAGRFVLGLLANDSAHAAWHARMTVEPAALAVAAVAKPVLVEQASPPRRAAWPPWALIAAGAAAAGYGTWALAKDGATASCQPSAVATSCAHYSSQTLGLVAVTGGGALVVSGAIWALLTHRSSSSRPSGPTSLTSTAKD
jgi:hypothetical protein